MGKDLAGTRTLECLKKAFAGEAQANRRYQYFAQQADLEGYPEIATLCRQISEGETRHAFGHFDRMKEAGDPVTDHPVSTIKEMLESAIMGEKYEYSEMYPGFAKVAREEGFTGIAEWFEALAKAERSHAARFQKALDALE